MIPDKSISGLQIERFIDPVSGKTDVHYLWNGSLVPKVRLSGKIAEQLSGLTLIQKDLGNAKLWMEHSRALALRAQSSVDANARFVHAKDRELFDHAKAFFVAAVTFYAKAFTEAAGRKAQMQRDWLDEQYRKAHDYYMEFRHNFAAHSGDKKVEYAHSYLLLVPEGKGRTALRLATNRVQPDTALDGTATDKFVDLIGHAITKVEERYFEGGKRMIEAAVSRSEAFWVGASHGSEAVNMDAAVTATRKRKK